MKKRDCIPQSKPVDPERFDLLPHLDSLVAEFERVQIGLSFGGERLRAWRDALTAATRFIEVAQGSKGKSTLTNPLRELAVALTDILRGARPDKIFTHKLKTGRPPDSLRSLLIKAASAASLQWLIRARVPSDEAANFVVGKLKKLGVKLPQVSKTQTIITASQIKRWRYSLNSLLHKRLEEEDLLRKRAEEPTKSDEKSHPKPNPSTKEMAEIEPHYMRLVMSLVSQEQNSHSQRPRNGKTDAQLSRDEAKRAVLLLLEALAGPPS